MDDLRILHFPLERPSASEVMAQASVDVLKRGRITVCVCKHGQVMWQPRQSA